MTLKIDLSPELEAKLREAAQNEGVPEDAYILNALRERLRQEPIDSPRLAAEEANLLREINAGLPEKVWQRYNALVAKRRAEKLTPAEQTELIALSDQIEESNVRRIEHLIALANLRRTSLEALMRTLGIQAPPYA